MMKLFYCFILSVASCSFSVTQAWQQCPPESGGGICPDKATCCPTDTPGISGCISSHSNDPPDGKGQCCDTKTGCGYGYYCDIVVNATTSQPKPICRRNEPHPDYLNAPETSRYEFYRLPPDTANLAQELHGFPIVTGDVNEQETYQLGYYSSMGLITNERDLLGNNKNDVLNEPDEEDRFDSIDTVLVVVHGSGRNADDYLYAGMSFLPTLDYNSDEDSKNTFMVIAPKFAADVDLTERALVPNLLYWADRGPDVPLGHTWRYGAAAMNNVNISSYDAMDKMIEHLLLNMKFLKRIILAGHSAGGQYVHRWTLLSSKPTIWEKYKNKTVDIRSIVANPRSYCYMDGRRILFRNKGTNQNDFAFPNKHDIDDCPSYNQWQWGLDEGGDVISHYKDRALNETSAIEIALRYGSRSVFYLTGEYDTIEQEDRCETYIFQGFNRNHRARNYFQAFNAFFSEQKHNHIHQFHVVQGSPHDHTLMFQSSVARKAIFDNHQIIMHIDNKLRDGIEQQNGMKASFEDRDCYSNKKESFSSLVLNTVSSFFAHCRELMMNLSFLGSRGLRGVKAACAIRRIE